MTRVAVIGMGYVGKAVARLFEGDQYELLCWDVADALPRPDEKIAACDVVFIAVPTPSHSDGTADVSAVVDTVMSIRPRLTVIKSTVPPGTCAQLERNLGLPIAFWPEYIGESSYHNPYFPSKIEEEPFVIIGGTLFSRKAVIDLLIPILGPTKTYYQCEAIEAELAKYAENAFFATKIVFTHQLSLLCAAVEADWHTVREVWLLDPRIGRMHTGAFPGSLGYDGKCLPKDIAALISAADDAGVDLSVLKEVQSANARLRELNPPSSAEYHDT